MSALHADEFPNSLGISIVPSEDGDGFDVDAVCRFLIEEPGRKIPRAQDWVWSGWAETPKRAAEYAASEWELRRSH